MFWLKGCKRCGGDLHERSDRYGYYITCLQCARTIEQASNKATEEDAPSVSAFPQMVMEIQPAAAARTTRSA